MLETDSTNDEGEFVLAILYEVNASAQRSAPTIYFDAQVLKNEIARRTLGTYEVHYFDSWEHMESYRGRLSGPLPRELQKPTTPRRSPVHLLTDSWKRLTRDEQLECSRVPYTFVVDVWHSTSAAYPCIDWFVVNLHTLRCLQGHTRLEADAKPDEAAGQILPLPPTVLTQIIVSLYAHFKPPPRQPIRFVLAEQHRPVYERFHACVSRAIREHNSEMQQQLGTLYWTLKLFTHYVRDHALWSTEFVVCDTSSLFQHLMLPLRKCLMTALELGEEGNTLFLESEQTVPHDIFTVMPDAISVGKQLLLASIGLEHRLHILALPRGLNHPDEYTLFGWFGHQAGGTFVRRTYVAYTEVSSTLYSHIIIEVFNFIEHNPTLSVPTHITVHLHERWSTEYPKLLELGAELAPTCSRNQKNSTATASDGERMRRYDLVRQHLKWMQFIREKHKQKRMEYRWYTDAQWHAWLDANCSWFWCTNATPNDDTTRRSFANDSLNGRTFYLPLETTPEHWDTLCKTR